MTPVIAEKSFEDAIECALLRHGPDACDTGGGEVGEREGPPCGDVISGGYLRRNSGEYDRALCLLPRDVTDFILATQPSYLSNSHQNCFGYRTWENLHAALIRNDAALRELDTYLRSKSAHFVPAFELPKATLSDRRAMWGRCWFEPCPIDGCHACALTSFDDE